MGGVAATRELLAPAADVWSFVEVAGRLADWWPGIFAARDDGNRWTVEGEERAGLGRMADSVSGLPEREETVAVEKSPPHTLLLHFGRSGYDATLTLASTAPNRTTATLSIEVVGAHETLAERLQEVVGVAVGGPDQGLAEAALERLYELCQTGADG